MMIAAMFGLLWLVVDLRKDTQNVYGVLVDRPELTGQPLETASTEFTVVNAVLVSRRRPELPAAKRRADSNNSSTALSTSPFWSPIPISSEMDLSAFTAIPSLSLAPPRISGFRVCAGGRLCVDSVGARARVTVQGDGLPHRRD